MNAPPSTLADVSSPTLYRDDTWREPFAAMRRDDPVHRHAGLTHEEICSRLRRDLGFGQPLVVV